MKDQSHKWIVWNPKQKVPSVIHYSEELAKSECERLSKMTGEEIYVYKCVGSYKPCLPPIEWVPATHYELDC